MTCTHTQQVIRKMGELIKKVNNHSSDLYIKVVNPVSYSDSSSGCLRNRNICDNFITTTDIRKDTFGKYLSEITEIISECDCCDKVIDKYDGLVDKYNNSVSKEEFNRVKRAYEELYESNKKDIKDYNELLRKHRVLEERCKNLTDRLGEYEDYKDKYEEIREEGKEKDINNARTKTRLEEKLEAANAKVSDLTRRLTGSENENDRLLIKLDEKNVIHNQKIENLNNQLAALKLESGEKTAEIKEKETELKRKDEEIKKLRSQKGLSREELLSEKLRSEKRSLELFANHELKIDMEQIHSLSKYHERLFVARKNHNQANIDVHEGNILRVKKELKEKVKISVINIQEICQKCERVAEFSWELNRTQQQYEARQEVPTNN